MMFMKIWTGRPTAMRAALVGVVALALAACAGTPVEPPLPQVDSVGQPIIPADDVAIAGQEASHSIMDLPEVADAAKPPLVRFRGVTSALAVPIDTEPYTDLLRDRLLLITREKLRFVEHTLPPLHPHKAKKEKNAPPGEGDADYELTALLRGDAGVDTYLIQIEFNDIHTGQTLFNGLYRIRPEATPEPAPVGTAPAPAMAYPSTPPPPSGGNGTAVTPVDLSAPAGNYNNPPYPPSSGTPPPQ